LVSVEKLEEIARRRGYKVSRIVRFKHRDRVVLEKPDFKVTLYLTKKLEELSEEELLSVLS